MPGYAGFIKKTWRARKRNETNRSLLSHPCSQLAQCKLGSTGYRASVVYALQNSMELLNPAKAAPRAGSLGYLFETVIAALHHGLETKSKRRSREGRGVRAELICFSLLGP